MFLLSFISPSIKPAQPTKRTPLNLHVPQTFVLPRVQLFYLSEGGESVYNKCCLAFLFLLIISVFTIWTNSYYNTMVNICIIFIKFFFTILTLHFFNISSNNEIILLFCLITSVRCKRYWSQLMTIANIIIRPPTICTAVMINFIQLSNSITGSN